MTSIHLGISTCPNDTLTRDGSTTAAEWAARFHGILEGKVEPRSLYDWSRP